MRLAILAALIALPALASPCKEARAGLRQRAKVTCAAARATALGAVKRARVQSAELEEEQGKLVYSFDLKVRGDPNVHEVKVDALTGEVVAIEVETPAQQEAERRADQKPEAK